MRAAGRLLQLSLRVRDGEASGLGSGALRQETSQPSHLQPRGLVHRSPPHASASSPVKLAVTGAQGRAVRTTAAEETGAGREGGEERGGRFSSCEGARRRVSGGRSSKDRDNR